MADVEQYEDTATAFTRLREAATALSDIVPATKVGEGRKNIIEMFNALGDFMDNLPHRHYRQLRGDLRASKLEQHFGGN